MIRFWLEEIPIRVRSWWRRHWWPSRIRLLEMERDDWKRWCLKAERSAVPAAVAEDWQSPEDEVWDSL